MLWPTLVIDACIFVQVFQFLQQKKQVYCTNSHHCKNFRPWRCTNTRYPPPQKRPFFGVCLLFLVGRKNDKTFLFLYKDVVRFPILTKFKHSFPTYLSSIVTPEIFDSEPLWKRITVRENLAFCLLGRHSETSLIFRGIKLEK